MAFEKGKAANPNGSNGRSTNKPWRDAIMSAIRADAEDGKTFGDACKDVAMQLVLAAKKGDVTALKEIGDRLDGKSLQSVEVRQENPLSEFTAAELRELANKLAGIGASDTAGAGETEAGRIPTLQ